MQKNLLNTVKLVRPPSSVFNMRHDHLLSCNMGELIPVMNEECQPGDRWRLNQEALVRLAPLVAPMFALCHIFFHCFFVPYRLLWANFENFITGTKVGGLDPVPPFITLDDASYTALDDYLGLPDPDGASQIVSALQHAAYQKIYADYYYPRSYSIGPLDIDLTDGDNDAQAALLRPLRQRGWGQDYFTSLLPSAQSGLSVDLPIGEVLLTSDLGGSGKIRDAATHGLSGPTTDGLAVAAAGGVMLDDSVAAGGVAGVYDPDGTLEVEATTIRDLRRAFKLQEFAERSIVGGTRYTEQNWSMFGVKSSDARLQRPEYVTGSKSPIRISEVLQTSQTGDESPQGNQAGHGIGVADGYGGSYYCEEHGVMVCIMSVMPDTGYFQGIPKKFLRLADRFQYPWPQFEHIGEQEILNKEIKINHATPEGVFGYGPRYMEYKVPFNRVSGDFRTTLKHWHMYREFGSDPALNQAFINSDPTRRVFAVTDEEVDTLYCHVRNNVQIRRLMSKYSTPHI